MPYGRIKTWHEDRGFGFVEVGEPRDRDAFLHITDLQAGGVHEVAQGLWIYFEVEKDMRGIRARNIRRATPGEIEQEKKRHESDKAWAERRRRYG